MKVWSATIFLTACGFVHASGSAGIDQLQWRGKQGSIQTNILTVTNSTRLIAYFAFVQAAHFVAHHHNIPACLHRIWSVCQFCVLQIDRGVNNSTFPLEWSTVYKVTFGLAYVLVATCLIQFFLFWLCKQAFIDEPTATIVIESSKQPQSYVDSLYQMWNCVDLARIITTVCCTQLSHQRYELCHANMIDLLVS